MRVHRRFSQGAEFHRRHPILPPERRGEWVEFALFGWRCLASLQLLRDFADESGGQPDGREHFMELGLRGIFWSVDFEVNQVMAHIDFVSHLRQVVHLMAELHLIGFLAEAAGVHFDFNHDRFLGSYWE